MRYARQEIFCKIGKEGQKRLKDSTVAVVGIGAIGSRSSELLARAGIGRLILVDRDIVELSNLQSQGLFTEEDIGKPKAIAAKIRIEKINSCIEITSYAVDLEAENVDLIKAGLVLDCTDNFETRLLINDFCSKNKICWIHSAAIRETGSVFVIKGRPCFACLFGKSKSNETCDASGILNTAANIAASFQANEAIKILSGKKPETGLLRFDVWKNELLKIKVRKNPECLACKGEYRCLEDKKGPVIKFCGSEIYQIKGDISLTELRNKLKNKGKMKDFGYCLQFENMTFFGDRALVKADSEKEAMETYSKIIQLNLNTLLFPIT